MVTVILTVRVSDRQLSQQFYISTLQTNTWVLPKTASKPVVKRAGMMLNYFPPSGNGAVSDNLCPAKVVDGVP
eukprot:14452776-Ditylum_brightwellii.AAC.1